MGELTSPLPDQATQDPPPKYEYRRRTAGLLRSFYFAFVGLGYLFKTQRNARIELALGLLACSLGAWLHISRAEWAIITFTIALVLILEGLNTAVEAAVDLSSPNLHPLAKAAKDLAAAMILITSLSPTAARPPIPGPPPRTTLLTWTRPPRTV